MKNGPNLEPQIPHIQLAQSRYRKAFHQPELAHTTFQYPLPRDSNWFLTSHLDITARHPKAGPAMAGTFKEYPASGSLTRMSTITGKSRRPMSLHQTLSSP